MTKLEYMSQLEAALVALPADERQEALRYYNEYFDESGLAESEVIARLGSPREVADTILRDFYTGTGKSWNTGIPYAEPSAARPEDRSFKGTLSRVGAMLPKWAWVIIGILTIPVWGPLLLSAVGAIFGVLCAIFAVLIFMCITVVGCVGCGVAMLIGGLASLFGSPAASLIILGSGSLLIAVGLFLGIPTVWLWGLVPKAFRAVSRALRDVFSDGRSVAA